MGKLRELRLKACRLIEGGSARVTDQHSCLRLIRIKHPVKGVSQNADDHAYESKRLTPAMTRMGKVCETIHSTTAPRAAARQKIGRIAAKGPARGCRCCGKRLSR